MSFYVYVIHDPRPERDNVPVWVGKGRGYRSQRHAYDSHNPILRRFYAKCRALNFEPLIEKVALFGDDEEAAFNEECRLIAKYGRRDLGTGTLYNLTNGGEGVAGSKAVSERMRRLHTDPAFAKARDERASARLIKLHADPEYARGRDERARALMAKLHADPEFLKAKLESASAHMARLHADPQFAKAHAERGRAAMAKLRADPDSNFMKSQVGKKTFLGRKHSEETKAKMSANNRRTNLGRKTPESVKAKLSLAQKGRVFTEEHRERLRQAGQRPEVIARRLASIKRNQDSACQGPNSK